MSLDEEPKPKKVSKEEYDIISNRLAVALAKREALIRSWTASSSRQEPPSKSQDERDAEDAALFRNQPPYLGVGAALPAHFLISDANQNNRALRAKFFPTKGLKASKARDADEKAASAKRAMRDVDSDEDQGRSALGRAKKLKTKPRIVPVMTGDSEQQQVSGEEAQSVSESMTAQKAVLEKAEPVQGVVNGKAKEDSKDVSVEDSPSLQTSMEDKHMTDTTPTENTERLSSQIKSTHTMDPQERKRMKKREKKKRAKLRATQNGQPQP
jgi:hypothetical protein